MSTRGAYGYYIDGVSKICYNKYDSYPGGLGKEIADLLRHVEQGNVGGWEALIPIARDIQMVEEDDSVKGLVNKSLKTFLLKHAGFRKNGLLRDVMVDGLSFLSDSLFCEHAYIINLDDGLFEYYRGFQDEPHALGRYAKDVQTPEHRLKTYYPVALMKTFSLDRMPKDIAAAIEESDVEYLARQGQEPA